MTSRTLIILLDNHYPKGHHRHLEDGSEMLYHFESVGKLADDYLLLISQEEMKRED